jgi:hypothetical protein
MISEPSVSGHESDFLSTGWTIPGILENRYALSLTEQSKKLLSLGEQHPVFPFHVLDDRQATSPQMANELS